MKALFHVPHIFNDQRISVYRKSSRCFMAKHPDLLKWKPPLVAIQREQVGKRRRKIHLFICLLIVVLGIDPGVF